jgi:hypothetical protein
MLILFSFLHDLSIQNFRNHQVNLLLMSTKANIFIFSKDKKFNLLKDLHQQLQLQIEMSILVQQYQRRSMYRYWYKVIIFV